MLHFPMLNPSSRRTFLRSAPLAAAGFCLAETAITTPAFAQPAPPVPFQLFTAAKLADAIKELQAKPGNNNLWDNPTLPFTIVYTTEEKKAGKEYEWHEGRDHIFQILEGSTVIEVGGKPEGAHSTKPGEWLAPTATGTTPCALKKGDMLIIPRGTLHKRTTDVGVTLCLISTTGK
jgi:mannose-6-phosphate isomerase-like protein (cupin superfamily)